MAFLKFKEGEKVVIRNKLQQQNLFRILELDMLIHPSPSNYFISTRPIGKSGEVYYRIDARNALATGWYSILYPNGGTAVAHESELITVDELDKKRTAFKRTPNTRTSGAISSWLENLN